MHSQSNMAQLEILTKHVTLNQQNVSVFISAPDMLPKRHSRSSYNMSGKTRAGSWLEVVLLIRKIDRMNICNKTFRLCIYYYVFKHYIMVIKYAELSINVGERNKKYKL